MSEHFYYDNHRRAAHFSNGECVDLIDAFADLARAAPASPARDAIAAAFAGHRGGLDLDDLPDVFAAPERLRFLVDLVATLARELARPIDATPVRFDPWDEGRQVQWLARLADMHDALHATAAARGIATDALTLDLPLELAQAVHAQRLEYAINDLSRRCRRAPWDAMPYEMHAVASTLIATALAPPGFDRGGEVLLHAYQHLAESCEALHDHAAAADAWRRAAAYAPAGAYRTSLLDCADEAEQASRSPRA